MLYTSLALNLSSMCKELPNIFEHHPYCKITARFWITMVTEWVLFLFFNNTLERVACNSMSSSRT